MLNSRQMVMESAALKLFRKSDRENKGFIVKRDMQRMKDDVALLPEQLEIVFDTLDAEKNGFLTLEQFLKGFREYLVITSSNTHILADYEEEDENTKNNYNNALTSTLDLIKGTNILKTSAEELEYISEQMKDRTGCQLSQWEIFLRDLQHDLQTYKDSYVKLEKLMKQKDTQHQTYVRKIFDEIELQFKEEKEKEEHNQQMQKRIKEEIRALRSELVMKDELLQQLNVECKELKKQLENLQKEKEQTSSLTTMLINEQSQYKVELEEERLKRQHAQNVLENLKRRFSFEKSQSFKEGYDLARRVILVQEEGLLQQLEMLKEMQRILGDENRYEER